MFWVVSTMENHLLIVRNIDQSINALDSCNSEDHHFAIEKLRYPDIWDNKFIIYKTNQFPKKLQLFYFSTHLVSSTNSLTFQQFTNIGKWRFAALSECLCELKRFSGWLWYFPLNIASKLLNNCEKIYFVYCIFVFILFFSLTTLLIMRGTLLVGEHSVHIK